jgi:hypothetical protein
MACTEYKASRPSTTTPCPGLVSNDGKKDGSVANRGPTRAKNNKRKTTNKNKRSNQELEGTVGTGAKGLDLNS